jgi:hypothetical protein
MPPGECRGVPGQQPSRMTNAKDPCPSRRRGVALEVWPTIGNPTACRTARSGGTTMTFPTTILGRTWPSARWGLQGLATASGPTRSEQVHHRLARVSADRPGLITDRVAAKICRVGPRMIGLWIETGAWPLPHAVRATTLYFRASDVECWLTTGTWPARRPVPRQGISQPMQAVER